MTVILWEPRDRQLSRYVDSWARDYAHRSVASSTRASGSELATIGHGQSVGKTHNSRTSNGCLTDAGLACDTSPKSSPFRGMGTLALILAVTAAGIILWYGSKM